MRRKLLYALIVLVLAGGAVFWFTRPLPILTVTTWPGAYGRAQAAALMHPYAAAKRIDVRLANWDGDLDEVRKAVAAHVYKGDVIDFELPKAVEACRSGLLERIDPGILPAGQDGTAAARDFVPGALAPCWVGSVVYSQAIIFRKGDGPQPTELSDFFDKAKFPGVRALNRAPKFNLEMALLADGVVPKDVYALLGTDQGLNRAFRKLESLGPIRWWGAPDEPIAMIQDGRAAMATALNGNIFSARIANVIWDHQLYEMDVFGVPAGDPRKDMAMDFIRFATGSVPLAGVASWVPYGPARRSSQALVGNNPDLGIAMKPWLPTSHFDTAFAIDDAWWQSHGPLVTARWQTWMAAH